MKRILWVTTLLLMAACKREITLGDDYGMSATDAGSGDDAAVSPGFVASSVQLPASVSELVGVENAWPTMALSGDGTTLAIGSPGDANSAVGINAMTSDEGAPSSGAVFVFRRHATEWVQEAYIKASNADINDSFGNAIALSSDGSTLAVGANAESSNAMGVDGAQANNGAERSGAVYVFERTDTNWAQTTYLKASDTTPFAHFGESVSLSGDGALLAVGTLLSTTDLVPPSNAPGEVFLFAKHGSTWQQEALLASPTSNSVEGFGAAVILSADASTLVVGAPYDASAATGVDGNETDTSAPGAGAAFVYTEVSDVWTQQAYLKQEGVSELDRFGTAFAISADGSTLIVHAGGYTSGSGAVFAFERLSDGWNLAANISPPANDLNTHCGSTFISNATVSLTADGSMLAMGLPANVCGSANEPSHVFLFSHEGAAWQMAQVVTPTHESDAEVNAADVALSGDGSLLMVDVNSNHFSQLSTGHVLSFSASN